MVFQNEGKPFKLEITPLLFNKRALLGAQLVFTNFSPKSNSHEEIFLAEVCRTKQDGVGCAVKHTITKLNCTEEKNMLSFIHF